MRLIVSLCFLLSFFLISGTANAATQIVASFSILADLAKQIGGDHIEVKSLIGPDGDTHSFEPKPGDAALLARANLIIMNGLGFEGWMPRLIEASGYKGNILIASDHLQHPLSIKEDGNIITDPHAWQDVANVRLYIANITNGLIATDPKNKIDYQMNAAKLDQELVKLDEWVKAEFSKIPRQKRIVISSHDAFGYFSRAYDVTFIAPIGLSTDEEPSAQSLKNITRQIREASIPTLFLENMSDTKLIRQLAAETGAKIGAALYTDALSSANGPAPSYQEMIRYNVGELLKAMQP